MDQLPRRLEILRNGLLGQDMLAGLERGLDVFGLIEDGQGDDDGVDVVAQEEVVVDAAGTCVFGVEVYVAGVFTQCLRGFEGARVEGFEGEVGAGLDCGLGGCLLAWAWGRTVECKAVLTRCSSLAKMPLPMMATPMDMIA